MGRFTLTNIKAVRLSPVVTPNLMKKRNAGRRRCSEDGGIYISAAWYWRNVQCCCWVLRYFLWYNVLCTFITTQVWWINVDCLHEKGSVWITEACLWEVFWLNVLWLAQEYYCQCFGCFYISLELSLYLFSGSSTSQTGLFHTHGCSWARNTSLVLLIIRLILDMC